jgi:putative transposase
VPANPLPATGGQAGIDVGIARYASISDGTGVDNPRWGRAAAGRLTAAQQRLARAKRRSKNRQRKRGTVAALHRKIANRRKDFHHKQPVRSWPIRLVGDGGSKDRQHAASGQIRRRS